MPKARPITEKELAEISRSVRKAWLRLFASYGPRQEVLRKITKDRLLKPEQRLMEEGLFNLQYREGTQLTDMSVRAAIEKAVERNDRGFFKRLGRVLSARPRLQMEPLPNRLAMFLVQNWNTPRPGVPELFYLTPDALAKLCSQKLKRTVTTDAVVKARRRLRLKPFRRQKRSAVFRGGRWTFPQVDKV